MSTVLTPEAEAPIDRGIQPILVSANSSHNAAQSPKPAAAGKTTSRFPLFGLLSSSTSKGEEEKNLFHNEYCVILSFFAFQLQQKKTANPRTSQLSRRPMSTAWQSCLPPGDANPCLFSTNYALTRGTQTRRGAFSGHSRADETHRLIGCLTGGGITLE